MTAWNNEALSRAYYAIGIIRGAVEGAAGDDVDALFEQLLDAIDQADERVEQAA